MKTERATKHATLQVSVWIQVEESQLKSLKSSRVPHKIGMNHTTKKSTAGLCIYGPSVEPEKLVEIEKLYRFLADYEKDPTDVNLVVSMVSNSDCNTVDIPNCVNEVMGKIGCKMVLSYTIM